VSMEDDERNQARHWLLTHLLPPASEGNNEGNHDTLTDLGLVGRTLNPSSDVAGTVAALTLLRHLREELAGWEPRLIAAARTAGASWVQLAPALDVASRQAAERRYLRVRPDDSGESNTGEQRVRAERDRRAGDRAVTRWARQNAAGLRRLGAQVSALDGEATLAEEAQRHVHNVTTALGTADATALIGPLTDVAEHLQANHSALADRIAAITHQSQQARHDSRDRPAERHATQC
jgi:hypothetical protein